MTTTVEPLQQSETAPAIIVSDIDYKRLTGLAAAVEDRAPDVATVLQHEMDRAQVVPADAIPRDVVQMGSTVEFSADPGEPRRVMLVFPGQADIGAGRISILTPIGAALIGLASGQSIAWIARDGRPHRLTVLSVEPPQASLESAGSDRG